MKGEGMGGKKKERRGGKRNREGKRERRGVRGITPKPKILTPYMLQCTFYMSQN
jgi:hypothetical protein